LDQLHAATLQAMFWRGWIPEDTNGCAEQSPKKAFLSPCLAKSFAARKKTRRAYYDEMVKDERVLTQVVNRLASGKPTLGE
jgi:hypothetical protein